MINRPLPRLLPAILGLSILTLAACRPDASEAAPYETAPVRRGNLVQTITASGSLSAVVSVDVGSQISGRISSLHADYNSLVKKGDLVAEIDPAIYLARMHQAEGELASAQAARELTRQTLARRKILVQQRAVTEADLDQAVAELAQAEAIVTVKKATLESTRVDFSYCKITAPVDGIVIARKVDVGQTVAATMTTPILFTIAQDLTKMHIETSVSEADIGQTAPGQKADFTVDAYPDEVFQGAVSQVRKAATTTNNVVTYMVVIDVDNRAQKLFPGMTADVSILVAERVNALTVINAALRFVPPEGAQFESPGTVGPTPRATLARSQRTVYLLRGEALKPVIVRTGITDGIQSEVLENLHEGDRVVTLATAKPAKGSGFPPPPQ